MQQYLETHPPCHEDSDRYFSEIEARQPFIKDDKTCFFLDDLQAWIMSIARERVKRKRVIQLIGLIGCKNWQVKIAKPQGLKGDTTRHVWHLPPEHTLCHPKLEVVRNMVNDALPDLPTHSIDGDLPAEIDF